MQTRRWPQHPPPDDELGVVVHGPVLLARGANAVIGLQHVIAYPTGLQLSLAGTIRPMLTAAERHSAFEAALAAMEEMGAEEFIDPMHDLRLLITAGEESGPATPRIAETSSQNEFLAVTASFWIDRLPQNRQLTLFVSWPSAHLEEAATTLRLDSLDDLSSRTLSLRLT